MNRISKKYTNANSYLTFSHHSPITPLQDSSQWLITNDQRPVGIIAAMTIARGLASTGTFIDGPGMTYTYWYGVMKVIFFYSALRNGVKKE